MHFDLHFDTPGRRLATFPIRSAARDQAGQHADMRREIEQASAAFERDFGSPLMLGNVTIRTTWRSGTLY